MLQMFLNERVFILIIEAATALHSSSALLLLICQPDFVFVVLSRFSDVDVPKNTIIMVKPMIPMASVTSIKSVANDECIIFKSLEELNRFISLYENEAQQERVDIINCLAHFISSYSTFDGVAVNFCSVMVNHGDPGTGANMRLFEKDGTKYAETITDVKAGDELYCDYREFDYMDQFWIQFCKDEGVKDVLITNLRQYMDL